MADLTELIDISNRYGADPDYVLAGGGNTSLKEDGILYVKASGHELSSITGDGFARLDLDKLNRIWEKEYPQDAAQREDMVLADMMAARSSGEDKRPSVEALLHGLLPQRYIVHLHPALVNGLTCAHKGEELSKKLFGEGALWIPLVNPGYILAKVIRDELTSYRKQFSREPEVIFLQNHGIFIGGDTIGAVDEGYEHTMNSLKKVLERDPDLTALSVDTSVSQLMRKAMTQGGGIWKSIYSYKDRELGKRLQGEEYFYPISSAFTPDHIVYSGFKPLWIPASVFEGEEAAEAVQSRVRQFSQANGVPPKAVAVEKVGVFTENRNALLLFIDTVKVASYSESFGGPLFMTDDQIDFIRNWEVEKYRAKVSES